MRNSHLRRIEEKKARKRIILSLSIVVISIIFLFFGGIPLFTKFSLLLGPKGDSTRGTNQDSLPLVPPHFEPNVEATNSSYITVHGFANAGETVKLIVNDNESEKLLVGKDGKFSILKVKLSEGENTLYGIVLKDQKESPPSEAFKIQYKKTPPLLEVSKPNDGENFFGDDKTITITGKTDVDVKIVINDRFVIVDTTGIFNASFGLNEGENSIKITATDIAGNETVVERKVTYKP